MPFIGKNKTTLELQKARRLQELQQKIKNQAFTAKARAHSRDTGTSLIQPKEKTGIENLLDKGKIDENLKNLITKDLGASPSQINPFIQNLDDVLKEFLLDRFNGFKKVFNDNYTIPSTRNLNSAFEIFNRLEVEKQKDIDVPTPNMIRDYLLTINENKLRELGVKIIDQLEKFSPARKQQFLTAFSNAPTLEAKVDLLAPIVRDYVGKAKTELDGFMALGVIFNQLGLRDAPKPKLATPAPGVPAPFINPPIPQAPPAPQTPQGGPKIMGVGRFKELAKLNVGDLRGLANDYTTFRENLAFGIKNVSYPKIKKINSKTKEQLIDALILRGYDPRTGSFDIDQLLPNQAYIDDSEPLGDDQIRDLVDYMGTNYDDIYNNPTLKTGVPTTIQDMEGFGMVKVFKRMGK